MEHRSYIPDLQAEPNEHLPANIYLFRQAILIVMRSPYGAERDEIINEIRLDIESKYSCEEINMQHRQLLLGLLQL